MNERRDTLVGNARGFSVVEILIALMIFAIAVLALASSGFVATKALRSGRSYTTSSSIAQTKLDSLTALGWDSLAGVTGSETVQGYPVSWEVQGTNPRRITLVVQRAIAGQVLSDTFVTYVALVAAP